MKMSKQVGVKGKFKSLFGRKGATATSKDYDEKQGSELNLSRELLKLIGKENNISQRARELKELSEVVETKAIEEHSIEALLLTVQDLLDPGCPTEGRQAALQFLIALVKGQYKHLKLLRSQIFRIIVSHTSEEDLHLRITLLNVLTNNGKEVSYCEQIGAFLVSFMSEALFSSNSDDFLQLLVNMVHYNSSFLDKNIICALVQKTCDFCTNANGEQEIESCLSLLDSTVRYGGLPTDGLFPLISTLCKTVNIQKFCQSSWKIMRNLVGTKIGHTAIFIMCQMLEDNKNIHDVILLRGAIFFIGMSIWGSKRVPSLHFFPIHVLPSFKISLQSDSLLIPHEISLSLQRLVKKFGHEQEIITWDLILDIIESLLQLLEEKGTSQDVDVKNQHTDNEDTESLQANVDSLLTNIEQLYTENRFYGSAERYFDILGKCAHNRPVENVMTLLQYYREKINPTYDDWLDLLSFVFENYFKKEKRTKIRIKVLNLTASIFSTYKYKYEDEILSLVLTDYISKILPNETDREVLVVISQLLSDILSICSCEKYPDVLEVIDQVLSSITNQNEQHGSLQEIEIIVDALIKVFKERLFEPSNTCVVNIFNMLVKHVDQHYVYNLSVLKGGVIRKCIFQLILSVRANNNHFIGIINHESKIKYSVHAIFKPSLEDVAGYGKLWLIDCDFKKAFDAIIKCLKNDLDWIVLEYVLKFLKKQLSNKNLFVYCHCNMSKLCAALCTMVGDHMYLNKVMNCPGNMGISELRNLIFPILSVIATYYDLLSKERQFDLVRCIEFGLNTHCAHTCVSCLTICTLEMQHVMVKLLPQILVKLSQISATVVMSVPVLEFLSTLKEIPKLYANFVEEQYMSIFAMALSYTDSQKYSRYIVTLAHQVIADWFTRCRLPFRKGFVTLIAKALNSHIGNENKDQTNFNGEMSDVCLDMMARYSFSHHLCEPKRTPIVDFLLANGVSETWLVGNMLITVTTSAGTNEECVCVQLSPTSVIVSPVESEVMQEVKTLQKPSDTDDSISRTSLLSVTSQRDQNRTVTQPTSIRTLPTTASTVTLESMATVKSSEDDVFSDFNTNHPGMPHMDNEKADIFVSASSEVLGEELETAEEEGCEPTPLVAKLTRQLVESNSLGRAAPHLFSPSEQLLFSRQASKVLYAENADDDDDDDDDDEEDESDGSEDDYFNDNMINSSNDAHQQVVETAVEVLASIEKKQAESNVKTQQEQPRWRNIPDDRKSISSERMHKAIPKQEAVESTKEQLKENIYKTKPSSMQCHCRCSLGGWAEVYMRRPSGNVSWVLKLENNDKVLSTQLADLSMMATTLDGANVTKKMSTSSSMGSLHRRRNSTGSIETARSIVSDEYYCIDPDEISTDESKQVPIPALPKKMPLTKSYSSPRDSSPKKTTTHEKSQHLTYHDGKMHIEDSRNMHAVQPRERICPSFVFLQLFYSPFGDCFQHSPILLEQNEMNERAMKVLDRTPSYNTHKFGVLYLSAGQEKSEQEILSNEFGSSRYTDFIAGLGDLVKLTDCSSTSSFTGGLDRNGADGKFAYVWSDDTTQVAFHIATLMPTKETDKQCVSKKLHIGNDFVTIIYDDSKHGYKFGTIKGQFNLAEVHIKPVEYNSNVVTVRKKDNSAEGYTSMQPYVISDYNLAVLIRQLAIHTNMEVVTEQSEKKTTNAYASNWLERLRHIKRIRCKVSQPLHTSDSHGKHAVICDVPQENGTSQDVNVKNQVQNVPDF